MLFIAVLAVTIAIDLACVAFVAGPAYRKH
jgi:hypothetical protein